MSAPAFLKIFVADLDRAQGFYGVFGMVERVRYAAPDFDERILVDGGEGGGFSLVLCQRREGVRPSHGDACGPIGFRLPEIEGLHAAALDAGASEVMAPRNLGAAWVSLLTDPDGHQIELLGLATAP